MSQSLQHRETRLQVPPPAEELTAWADFLNTMHHEVTALQSELEDWRSEHARSSSLPSHKKTIPAASHPTGSTPPDARHANAASPPPSRHADNAEEDRLEFLKRRLAQQLGDRPEGGSQE